MPSYIPEHVYSFTGWDDRNQPTYGLVPWPKHLQPREPGRDIQLTKKGESYVQAALAEAGGVFFLTLDRRDRVSIATTIERLIDMLDALDEDADLEPSLGSGDDREGDFSDHEHSLGWGQGSQSALHTSDEREEENEHGGDIQDVPHDAVDEGNDEPFLGWSETYGQGHTGLQANLSPADPDDVVAAGTAPLHFDGDGCLAGREVLRNLRSARPDVQQEYIGGWCDGNRAALKVKGLTITGTLPRNPTLSPESYPDRFTCIGDGTCCEPVIMDGQRIMVDRHKLYRPGDFVVVYRDPATVAKGDHVWKIKRFVVEDADFIVVEMLNPLRRVAYQKSQVLAVWHAEPVPADYVPGPKVNDRQLMASDFKRLPWA